MQCDHKRQPRRGVSWSRRQFLQQSALATLGLTLGCTGKIRSGGAAYRPDLTVVFLTDVHTNSRPKTPAALQMAAEAITRVQPDFVIAGGDLIAGGFDSQPGEMSARWATYLDLHRGLNREVYPVIGNHDLVAARPRQGVAAEDPRAEFRSHMNLRSTYYAIDALGYHFIFLDSLALHENERGYQGRISQEQVDWLRHDLSTVGRDTPIVMTSHMPLMTGFYQATQGATTAAPEYMVVNNSLEVLQLFENHNLLAVLQGHLHVWEEIRWRNTAFITGGAICGKWWGGGWHDTEEGFGVLQITKSGVRTTYVDYGWVV